ncbi:hypothetical protein DFH09DRAFT_1453397 [Mycena vulgaris]|nr:hypothetical protein DFH09DRAFT_1453397 [Mycena vulgaris]
MEFLKFFALIAAGAVFSAASGSPVLGLNLRDDALAATADSSSVAGDTAVTVANGPQTDVLKPDPNCFILYPCVGPLFDRYGRRVYCVSATALLWILVYSLMGFTQVHPMVPAILGSFALSFNAIPFIAAIPATVLLTAHPTRHLVSGKVVLNTAYDNVLYFLIAIKAIDAVYGPLYQLLDVRYFGSVLRMSEAEKLRDLWTVLGFGVMFSITAVMAWVLYLAYSQGS